mmetsp:Transcript_6329/g.10684  ORF Transcript_6329/g.10684 Transcript_6329/m.10684 type:complete len:276 (-) Transcript_6329:745-1572(-)
MQTPNSQNVSQAPELSERVGERPENRSTEQHREDIAKDECAVWKVCATAWEHAHGGQTINGRNHCLLWLIPCKREMFEIARFQNLDIGIRYNGPHRGVQNVHPVSTIAQESGKSTATVEVRSKKVDEAKRCGHSLDSIHRTSNYWCDLSGESWICIEEEEDEHNNTNCPQSHAFEGCNLAQPPVLCCKTASVKECDVKDNATHHKIWNTPRNHQGDTTYGHWCHNDSYPFEEAQDGASQKQCPQWWQCHADVKTRRIGIQHAEYQKHSCKPQRAI